MNYESTAVELIRALRGRRSCADFSRRAGYRSNIALRWEARQCWPTASRFLQVQRRLRPKESTWIERFFQSAPDFLAGYDPVSPPAVAAFLRWLKGKTPIIEIARLTGHNRYSVSRWFEGSAEPKLPELLDLLAALEDPAHLPSVRPSWTRLQLAREAAYTQPFSHAVLRALELDGNPRGLARQHAFIAARLGISVHEVEQALVLLTATGQVKKTRGGLKPTQVMTVDTNHDPLRARDVKLAWTSTALARVQRGDAGSFGYSLFAISKADLGRLEALHLQYVRAMQAIIANSTPNECVGLYCAQLLDLGASWIPGDH
jgi:hypothetical protein